MPDAPRCPACDLHLDGLPAGARFCPWCGEKLPAATATAPPPPPRYDLHHRLEHLQALVRDHLGDGPPPATLEEIHSLMILGYADAMCQLGWRYETGNGGALRNPEEAKRCYEKSARLGNDYAQSKLQSPPEDAPPAAADL